MTVASTPRRPFSCTSLHGLNAVVPSVMAVRCLVDMFATHPVVPTSDGRVMAAGKTGRAEGTLMHYDQIWIVRATLGDCQEKNDRHLVVNFNERAR
jgi:hypothetical protein